MRVYRWTEITLPRLIASSTDTTLKSRRIPLIGAVLPRRAVLRNDTELLKASLSKVESLSPSLTRLHAEKTLPALS